MLPSVCIMLCYIAYAQIFTEVQLAPHGRHTLSYDTCTLPSPAPLVPIFVMPSKVQYSRTPLIRTLIFRIANYPDRLRTSEKFVDNSTKTNCLDVTAYRIKYSTVLWLLELQSGVVEMFIRRYIL